MSLAPLDGIALVDGSSGGGGGGDLSAAQLLARRGNDLAATRIEQWSNVSTSTAQALARRNVGNQQA
jgi:hypothetical protein